MGGVSRAASWEHFDHGADVGVRGVGPTKEAAFEQIAVALTATITDPAAVRPAAAVEIVCEAPTDELLVVDWLNALVYEMATRRVLFARYEVKVEGARLRAKAFGEPVDVPRHSPAVEVKGATWTGLRVLREGSGWLAECVVDV